MREKGSASGVVMGIIALCLVVLIGLGIYAYSNTVTVADDSSTASSTQVVYVATTTTSYVATTTTTEVLVPRTSKPVATSYVAPRTNTASSYSAYTSVNGYHSPYGLTVPGNYYPTIGRDVYAGVYDTASLHFSGFQINVFSKEEWNDIRIQETVNNKEGTGPTYFGEGSYLGENKTWIFSIIPGAYGTVPYGIRFY